MDPVGWSSGNTFDITWIPPSDHSGIKIGAYYYVGIIPPVSQSIGTWHSTSTLPITVTTEGETHIYIWLQDNAGNKNYMNFTTATLKYDKTAPRIVHIPITKGTEGEDITITATVTDDHSGVHNCELYYKKPSENSYSVLSMVETDDTYTAKITGSSLTSEGLEYYIEAYDRAEPANVNYYGLLGDTSTAPISSNDIDIKVGSYPQILDYSPTGSYEAVSVKIKINFDRAMNKSATQGALQVLIGTKAVEGTFEWSDSQGLTWTPMVPFKYGTTYKITLLTSCKDENGNHLEAEFKWNFTTEQEKEQPDTGKKTEEEEKGSGMVYGALVAVVAVVVVVIVLFFMMQKKKGKAKQPEEEVDEATKMQQAAADLYKDDEQFLQKDEEDD